MKKVSGKNLSINEWIVRNKSLLFRSTIRQAYMEVDAFIIDTRVSREKTSISPQ
jgi:hypothetical protein